MVAAIYTRRGLGLSFQNASLQKQSWSLLARSSQAAIAITVEDARHDL